MRFIGCLLAKVGLDCVTCGLDVDRGRERDADDTAARTAPQTTPTCWPDVRGHARVQRPIRGDRDRAGGTRCRCRGGLGDRQAGCRRRVDFLCERAVWPHELEVLLYRGGLPSIGQELPERGGVLVGVEGASGEISSIQRRSRALRQPASRRSPSGETRSPGRSWHTPVRRLSPSTPPAHASFRRTRSLPAPAPAADRIRRRRFISLGSPRRPDAAASGRKLLTTSER